MQSLVKGGVGAVSNATGNVVGNVLGGVTKAAATTVKPAKQAYSYASVRPGSSVVSHLVNESGSTTVDPFIKQAVQDSIGGMVSLPAATVLGSNDTSESGE
jgi:hypothetical protein